MSWLHNLRHDLPASIVVLFVAVPLCLGIALASGAPLVSGLIAGIVGGLVVGALSRSPLGVSGPAAGLAVIVLHGIEDLGFEGFLVAVVIAGGIQVALGAARAGVLGYFFPSAVIKGMLAGIGIIIVLKQIPHAFGYDADYEGDLAFVQDTGETTLSSLVRMFENIDPRAVFVAAVALVVLVLWDRVLSTRGRFFQLVQGPIVAVSFGILYELVTSQFFPTLALSREHLVDVPVIASTAELGEILRSPDWARIGESQIWLMGLTIAIVASIETLLCVEATDKLDPLKRITPTSRELVAQGVGNTLSGLLGGLPVTQVIVRSSANIQSGARSKTSAILHGALLLVFVGLLPQVLNLVPLAVLASILLVVGYKLAKPAVFLAMYGLGRSQFVPFVVTVLGVVLTDLLTGIGIGMAVAVLVLLRRNYLNSHFLHIDEGRDQDRRPVVKMQLSEEVTFLNKGAILKELASLPDNAHVWIDTSRCYTVDHDILEVIQDFESTAASRGIVKHVGPVTDEELALAQRAAAG